MPSNIKPIYSMHEEDLEIQEEVNAFVVGLAERVDLLQDLHSLSDLGQLGELCGGIGDEAERLGYPLLAAVARAAAEACLEGKANACQDSLLEITELTQRIRQAHRGAA